MAKNFKDEDVQDNDPTDELPILTDAVLESERTAAMRLVTADDDDTGTFGIVGAVPAAAHRAASASIGGDSGRIGALESELASLKRRWQEIRADLAERDTELASLRELLDERATRLVELADSVARAGASLEERDAQIASLTAALEAAQSNINTLEDTARALEQQIVTLEAAQADRREQDPPPDAADTTQQLREALASLSQHIENRNAIWQRHLAEIEQKATRIGELEIELAQRQARQHAAERHAEVEAARVRELRVKLLAAERERADRAPAPSRGPSRDRERPDRLREELRRAIALQTELGDGPANLRRLEDLEVAIRELEQQMDGSPRAAPVPERAPEPERTPEPARLVCLTGDELGNLALEKASVTIGRGGHCGIQIATHYVSREHARLTSSDGRWIIEDLGSRNGVFVNAVRIERQALDDKDLITIGDTQFRYQSGSPPRN